MFFVSGCVVRTYTVERDRVDQAVYGNKGFIMGTAPAATNTDTEQVKKTREIYNVEVELPSSYRTTKEEKARYRNKDKELYGNRGYVSGSMTPEKEVYVSESGNEKVSSSEPVGISGASRMPQVVYNELSASTGTQMLSSGSGAQNQQYVVQKGDTLQKISQKFFKTTQRWKSIYDANKNILKSPDRIRPGQKLLIPKD